MSQSIAHGSQFQLNTTGSTYVAILGMVDADFPGDKVDTPETTDMGTSGIERTFTSGLHDAGEFTAKFNRLPGDATQIDLETARDAGGVHNFKFVWPSGLTTSFSGVIASVPVGKFTDDKLITFDIKVKISGKPVTA